MRDRLLSSALHWAVLVMIMMTAGAALACANCGGLWLLSGSAAQGTGLLIGALGAAIAMILLIRYREDLI